MPRAIDGDKLVAYIKECVTSKRYSSVEGNLLGLAFEIVTKGINEGAFDLPERDTTPEYDYGEKLAIGIQRIRQHLRSNPGLQETGELERMLGQALDEADVTQMRDFTPEEALSEARKRWGDGGSVELNPNIKEEFWIQVGRFYRLEEEYEWYGSGKTFREAFENADKAAKS